MGRIHGAVTLLVGAAAVATSSAFTTVPPSRQAWLQRPSLLRTSYSPDDADSAEALSAQAAALRAEVAAAESALPRADAEGEAPPPARKTARDEGRTADAMAPGWKVLKIEELGKPRLELAPTDGAWGTKEIEVEIPRTAESPGLGILLEEYGGDAVTGVGLTLVAGLVEGGNAALSGVDLLPGDAIVDVGGVRTECFNWDLTVDALGGLPAAPAPAILTVKRLLKIPVVKVRLRRAAHHPTPQTFYGSHTHTRQCTVMFPPEDGRPDQLIELRPGSKMRRSLQKEKIMSWDAPCNEDLQCLCNCGILVRKGLELFAPPSTQERLMLENHKEPYWRLTCRACVIPLEEDAEMVIRVKPDLDNVMEIKDPGAWRT